MANNQSVRRHLDAFTRGRIIGKLEEGRSVTSVAAEFGIAHSIVSRLWRQFQTTGTAIRGFSSGRPRGTTPADDRRLHGGGLFTRRPVRCVPLTPAHRRRRSLWCREHRNWRDNEWGRVLFTDESRFSLSSDSHRILIWRERGSRNHPSNIIERDRYKGRGVLVWGGIMFGSRTDLHIFNAGSVNGTRYCNEILLPYVRLFRGAMGLQFLFMDDNAPCHRTVAAEQLLESEDIERMDWPARSPDLNPIEHVWDFLGRRLAARTLPPVTIRELRLALQDEWAAMPQQLIDTLILSMGRRCETCLAIWTPITGMFRPSLVFPRRKSTENLLDTSTSSSTSEIMTVDPILQKIVEKDDKVEMQEDIQADSNFQLDIQNRNHLEQEYQNDSRLWRNITMREKTYEISGVKEIPWNVNILTMIFWLHADNKDDLGFSDWKNAAQRMEIHEYSSTLPPECVQTLICRRRTHNRIDSSLGSQFNKEQEYWTKVLQRVVSVIKFLSSRGIAFRGDVEHIGSQHNVNYLGILELIVEYDPFLSSHMTRYGNKGQGKPSYLSSEICEEIIKMMRNKAQGNSIKHIQEAKYISLSVDTRLDIPHTDQLTVGLRYLRVSDGEVAERFLTFIPIKSYTGEVLASTVFTFLKNAASI
ncbi:transposable element Tcb2 transposase [Trichonephila clavipes]|nr:transposable element Tcb2 transposase [Trichonephila clavipes]